MVSSIIPPLLDRACRRRPHVGLRRLHTLLHPSRTHVASIPFFRPPAHLHPRRRWHTRSGSCRTRRPLHLIGNHHLLVPPQVARPGGPSSASPRPPEAARSARATGTTPATPQHRVRGPPRCSRHRCRSPDRRRLHSRSRSHPPPSNAPRSHPCPSRFSSPPTDHHRAPHPSCPCGTHS